MMRTCEPPHWTHELMRRSADLRPLAFSSDIKQSAGERTARIAIWLI
jgi:hypothetical protein